MKNIAQFVRKLILAVNILFVVLLIISAYSTFLHPVKYPILSCAGLTFPVFYLLTSLFFYSGYL